MGDYPTLRPAVTLGVLLRCGSVILSVHSTAVVMVNAMEKKRLATVKLMDVHVAMVCAMIVKIPIIVPKTANVIIMVSAKTGKRRQPALLIVLVGIISASLNYARPCLLVNMTVVVIETLYVNNMKIMNVVLRIVQRILLRIFQMHLLMKKWRSEFRIVYRCIRMILLFRYTFNYARCRDFILYRNSLILNIPYIIL